MIFILKTEAAQPLDQQMKQEKLCLLSTISCILVLCVNRNLY